MNNDKAHFDDLTKINVPFGLLDDDTQERLQAYKGKIQFLDPRGLAQSIIDKLEGKV